MSKTGKPDDGMEAMFAAARTHAPEPDADFLARVLGDAEAVQAGFAERAGDMASDSASAGAARLYPAPARGLRGVFAALGGWPAVAGLGAAALGLADGALHRAGHAVGIEDDAAVDVAGRAADGLDERGARPEESLLVRVEDRDEMLRLVLTTSISRPS